MSKCRVIDEKFVEPCANLRDVTEPGTPSGKRKGVLKWELSIIGKGPSRSFFGVKSGDYAQKGLIFNFCPFCGERIDAPVVQQQGRGDE